VESDTAKTPNFDDELEISRHFQRPFLETWEELAQKSLKGRSPSSLEQMTHENLAVKPLYTAEDVPLDTPPIGGMRRGPIEIAIPIDLREPEGTTGRIVEARDFGAHALWLWVDRRTSSWGQLTAGSFALFREAGDGAQIYLDARGAAPALAALLIASTHRLESAVDALAGGFDFDPIGVLAADGKLPTSLVSSFDLMAEAIRWCEDNTPRMRTVAVSTLPHAKAGATAVQELASALATGVAYLRAMEQRGISPDIVCRRIRLVTSIGRDLFMETAKLRALRAMWARVTVACGIGDDQAAVPIHAVTSPRCLTIRDPWVNILRGTAAAYTAVVGGADVVTVLPYDAAAGRSDDFAHRLAANTCNILREESHIDRVHDPAAGSYLVEKLTSDLCAAAWDDFQRIEATDGFVSHLRTGALTRELAESLARKRRHVATLRDPVTGVSSFPNLEEELIHRHRARREAESPDEIPTAVHRSLGAETGSFSAVLESADGGVMAAELVDILQGGDEKVSLSPVLTEREARPFEALRDASDQLLRSVGARPRVFVALAGSSAETRGARSFITNLLAAGGIIAILGKDLENPDAITAAFAASGSRAAVICSTSDRASEVIPALARKFKAHRALRVLVANDPGDLRSSWMDAGVDGFIRRNVDAVALLADLLEAEGVDHG
jgi:methylmalonyl-CoA mutase